MYQQFAFTFPDNFNIKSVSDIQVYNGFILTLPFRLRTGTFFSLQVGNSFDIIFRNRLDIPHGTSSDEVLSLIWEGKKPRPREQFFTEALILDKHPTITADFREQFIAFMENSGDEKLPGTGARYFQAITSLNDAIVGYHHATSSLFGGMVVERITTPIFFDRLRYLHTIVCPSDYELSQPELLGIIDARGNRKFTQLEGQFTLSQLDDVPADQLARIQQYTEFHQRFLFYQFALDAKSKMVERDFVSAILFAVVALEGVHSALLQMRLDRRMATSINDSNIRAKRAEAIANRLLRDVGFSESLEMTSLLFWKRKSDHRKTRYENVNWESLSEMRLCMHWRRKVSIDYATAQISRFLMHIQTFWRCLVILRQLSNAIPRQKTRPNQHFDDSNYAIAAHPQPA